MATMCILGYRVSAWEACPIYIPHYCACEITDQPQLTLINMCSYEIEEGEGCKPCPPDLQDYANCTSCPGKTCPVCAPDENDMLSLQRSVSLDTYEDLKKIGQITTSYSFKLAQNSSIINKTDEDESPRTKNATEDDQNKDEEIMSEENQPLKISNAIIEDQSGSQQNFSDENQTTRNLNNIEEDPHGNGENFSEENQTSRNENTAEEDQNSSEWESSEQDGNTTDQYFSDEDYGSEKINNIIGLKEKDGSVEGFTKEQQRNKTSHDQKFEMESNLNDSLNYTRDGLISEKYGNDSYKEYDNDEMFTEDEIVNSTSETEKDFASPGKTEARLDLKSSTTDQLSPLETASSKSFVSAYDTDSRKVMDVPGTDQSDIAEKKSRETDIVAEAQKKGYINDDKNLKLDNSDGKNVKIWFSGERYPSEQNMPDVETFEDNRDISIGMNESFSSLPNQAFRQPYLQTEIPDEEFKGEEVHSREDIKPSDARSLLMKTEQSSDNFESTNSSTSIKETPKYNDGSFVVDDTLNGRTLNPIVFTLSSQPGEMYYLRGENSQNDSLSENIFSGSADKFAFENISSELENNNSRNVLSDEINSKMTIEKEDKSVHLIQDVDKKNFSKNNYVKDVIKHVFYDESNSTIQTIALDVIFVNYLKHSTGMPDLTTFYFLADISPEEKVDINLVRICFLNQNFSTITADELNLCRKEMVSIPESSSLLTVRVQNSYIFKQFAYNTFDEENEHTDENQAFLDRSSLLSPNERESGFFNGHDYKLLRKGAEKFVLDSFDFRKLYDLWITPQNESSETFRFCHDIDKIRVCKNYENDTRIHMKLDDRFHIFVSAFLDRATLFDMHAAQFIRMQLSKHSYIMSNTSTASDEENVDGNKSLEIIEDSSGESSVNLTEESQYDFESEKTLSSYSNVNEKMDTNMSKTPEGMNLSSSEDPIDSNFSDEIGDTEKDSFTRVNDSTEEVPSGKNESLTDDIQENESEHEQDEGSTRFRRAANSTKHSPDDWCDYTKRTFNGSITCYQWTYKKECTIECHPGYDYAGEKSKQFTCKRKDNVWVPELTPCMKGSGFTNINEGLGLDTDIDENMKSHKEANDEDANVSAKASTDGFKEKSHNLLSNYQANDFNFDNYAYDKNNYDSPSDEYE